MTVDFEALIRSSTDVIAVIDGAMRLIYANPAAERLLELAVGEQIGQQMSRHVHPDDMALVVERLVAITSGGPSGIPISIRIQAASGEWKVLQVVGASRVDDPDIQGIVLNGRDITEQTRTAQALERSLERTIRTLGAVVELRDRYTAGHQERVADLAGTLASELQVDADTAKGIRIAASLHDIGKIAVPAEILNKPGRLSEAEMAVIHAHPQTGHDLVADIEFPWPVARMILEHHERHDGTGYPSGRSDGQTLLGSRIIAVADVMEAISINRPYHASGGVADALAEIRDGAGTRYDPRVAHTCVSLFERGEFTFRGAEPG